MIKSWRFWELWIRKCSASFCEKCSGRCDRCHPCAGGPDHRRQGAGQFVGDFTWYMRNLLLVKTSENPEEAIDVSSENLKLLKEESEMVDVETLMRYIRIFSDLSNQIRYATQKRVLVEIALIKLCRPAMETNLDSVLDRLRVLEQRMDERPVQQVFVQGERGRWQRRKYRGRIVWQCRSHGSSTREGSSRGSAEDCSQLEGDRRSDQRYFQTDGSSVLFPSTTARPVNRFSTLNSRISLEKPM